MRFIFNVIFLSLVFSGVFYYFERKSFIEIFFANLIVVFIFLGFFKLLFVFVSGLEEKVSNIDEKTKKGLFAGILIGLGIGWIIGSEDE
jgi:hypothetical protein